jgi:hypothetical protein
VKVQLIKEMHVLWVQNFMLGGQQPIGMVIKNVVSPPVAAEQSGYASI